MSTSIDPTALPNNVQLMFRAMDGILEAHDEATVDQHFHADFVQHNPWAQDGAHHVKQMCAFEFKLQSHRWVGQGDLVAYHGIYTAPNPLGDMPLLCTDLWRVQGDQIVEHWDCLQPIPPEAVESFTGGGGDGGASISPEKVHAHVAMIRGLLEGADRAGALADDLVLHRPEGGGRAGFEGWLDARTVQVRATVASGDLVMTHLATAAGSGKQVVFAWFRVADGKVMDIWITSQDIVPSAEAANRHPHF